MKLNQHLIPKLTHSQQIILPKTTPLKSGIAHFGVGAFHRAHQALYTQLAMEESGNRQWGITGVGIMPFDKKMNEVLKQQDFLYTLVEKGTEGEPKYRIINSIFDHIYGVDNWKEVVEKLSTQEIKIITLTITEGGYNINRDSGEFDLLNPVIKEEILGWKEKPQTIFGYLTQILDTRMKTHGKGLTILSCDNIQHNGKIAEKSFCCFLIKAHPELLNWVKENCTFPNSMVDRITPQINPKDIQEVRKVIDIDDRWPVVCQDFKQWVVEDKFAQGRPQWEKVGVQFVEDVTPYEKMKLRILNGSHQALCYLGYLEGYKYVDQAASDKLISEFVLRYLTEEVVETLDPVPGINLEEYQKQILIRFSNSNIKDTISRICQFTSDRIPLFNVPSMLDSIKNKKSVPFSAMIIASWIAYAGAKDSQGKPINIVDNRKEQIMEIMKEIDDDGKTDRFLKMPGMFGGLATNEQFLKNVEGFYKKLKGVGVRKSLQEIL